MDRILQLNNQLNNNQLATKHTLKITDNRTGKTITVPI